MTTITIEIPVEIGTTVYLVHDKCCPPPLTCIFEGGYGTNRCRNREHKDLCEAYYEPVKFTLCLNDRIGKDVFITEAKAQKKVNKLNSKK